MYSEVRVVPAGTAAVTAACSRAERPPRACAVPASAHLPRRRTECTWPAELAAPPPHPDWEFYCALGLVAEEPPYADRAELGEASP